MRSRLGNIRSHVGGIRSYVGTGAAGTTPAPTYATMFAVSAPSSFVVGVASAITISPIGGPWNGQSISGLVSGISGALGQAVTATGSSPVSISFTPSATGSGSVDAAANGMTSTGAQNVTVIAAAAQGSAPAVLSGVIWHQPMALDPSSQDYAVAGWGEPVGGIGPFTWSSTPIGNFNHFESYPAFGPGAIRVWGGMPSSPNFTLICTDARGDSKSIPVTVAVSSVTPVISVNGMNPAFNGRSDTYFGGPFFRADCPGLSVGDFNVTLQDGTPSTQWTQNYEAIRWYQGGSATITPGDYPIRIHPNSGSAAPVDFTIHIKQFPSDGYIEFTPNTIVSTSVLAGVVIGRARATTPANTPVFAVDDFGAGILNITPQGVLSIKSQPSAVGNVPYRITVTDGQYSYPQDFVLPVVQGETLPASNMTGTVATNLLNYADYQDSRTRPVLSPSVAGFPDMSQVRWSLRQERFSWSVVNLPDYNPRNKLTFGIDPATGAVVAQGHTPAGSTYLILTATDGVRTCTNSFPLTVGVKVGPVVHVGTGMSNLQTRTAAAAAMTPSVDVGIGFEHLGGAAGFLPQVQYRDGVYDMGGASVFIHYNSDPEYYTSDYGNPNVNYPGIGCTTTYIGVPSDGHWIAPTSAGIFPRLGGPMFGASGGGASGKGFFNLERSGDYRFINLEISFVHSGAFNPGWLPTSGGIPAVFRFNDFVGGNFVIDNCDLHNNDICIETGMSDGFLKVTRTRVSTSAACFQGGGNQHNTYLGRMWRVDIDGSLWESPMGGHNLKIRAAIQNITNTRFLDGTRGSSFSSIDCCEGSQITIDGCVIQRGVMTQNPFAVQFWEEAGRDTDFDLPPNATITRTVFVNYTPLVGSTFTALVGTAKFMNPQLRVYASVAMDGCSSWGVPIGKVATASGPQGDPAGYLPDGDTHDFTPTVTNHTYLTAPPLLDFTPPTTHNHGRSYYHNAVADLDNPVRWRNMYDAQIDPGVDQIRISKSAPAGTIVFTPTAFGCTQFKASGAAQPDPRINPYGSNDAWSIGSNLGDPYGYQYGFDTAKYVVNPNNGQVTVRNTLDGSVGMDLVPIRNTPADTTNGRVVEWAFAVERV